MKESIYKKADKLSKEFNLSAEQDSRFRKLLSDAYINGFLNK